MSQASLGAEPDAFRPAQDPAAGRAGQDRAAERRRRELVAADEEDVRRRRLGQEAVGRQEQRVVCAGRPRLDPRVDVVGPGRRLERRRAGSPGRAGRVLETRWRPRSRWSAGVGGTGQAWMTIVGGGCSSGGSRPRPKKTPRETVIRMLASPSGPARPSAASELRDPGGEPRLRRRRAAGSRARPPIAGAGRRAPAARSAGRPAPGASRTRRRRAGSRGRTRTGAARRPAAAARRARRGRAGEAVTRPRPRCRRSPRAARAPWRRSRPTPPRGRSGR